MRSAAVAFVLAVAAAGCFAKPGPPSGGGGGGGSDASVGTCSSFGPWTGPTKIGPSTRDFEYGPWISPDGLDLYYSYEVFDFSGGSVRHIKRADTTQQFDQAAVDVPLGPNGGTPEADAHVFLSDDQLTAYWDHKQSSFDIMTATRSQVTDDFGPENELGVDQNGPLDTYDATVTMDGLTMVYAQGGASASNDHLYVSTRARTIDDFATGTMLVGAFVSGSPRGASLSANGSELFWADTTANGYRLFTSTRVDATTYSAPAMVVGQPMGASYDNIDPMLTRDGKTLAFASDSGNGNLYDLYVLTRVCL